MTTPTTIVFGTDTTRVPFEEDTVEYDYEMFTSKDFNVQHNFGTTLARLLQALANSSSGTNIDGTPCQQVGILKLVIVSRFSSYLILVMANLIVAKTVYQK